VRTLGSLLLLGGLLAAQPGPVRLDRVRADIFFLASPALEGRRSGARGSEVAIEWVASEFAKAGLKPVAGTSFKQAIPLVEYRVDSRASGLTLRRGEKEETLRSPAVTASFPRDYEAKGAVVFAGFGITAPELGYDDYASIDARGKFVLIFEDEPQEDDPRSVFSGRDVTLYSTSAAKAANAVRHGAVAVLVAPEPNRRHPAYRELSERRRNAAGARRGAVLTPQALDPGPPAVPMIGIDDQTAAAILAASGKTPAGLQAAIDGTGRPASAALPGVEAEVRIVLAERRRIQTANLLGLVEGSDPRLKDETVLVCGHYDHNGINSEGAYMPGADDNASGTAAVVELARVFAAAAVKPRRTIVFAALGAEESGLLGAHYYAWHPPRPLESTRVVLNLDMLGRNETETVETKGLLEIAADTSNELNLMGTTFSAGARETVERANAGVGLALNYKWEREPALKMLARSDHLPFLLQGVPSVFFFTGFHPDYHTPADTADKINFQKLGKILELARRTAAEFADTAEPPRFRTTKR
jgi:hypothetical protein